MDDRERIEAAIELAVCYGGIDGDHHKAWVIDQMVRALTGGTRMSDSTNDLRRSATDEYRKLVADARAGDDGPETFDWNEGIVP